MTRCWSYVIPTLAYTLAAPTRSLPTCLSTHRLLYWVVVPGYPCLSPLPFPSLSSRFSPLLFPPLPLEEGPPLRLGGLEERLSSPSESGRSPAAKRYLVHFQPIWRHFLQTFSCSLSFVKLLFHVANDVKYIVVISKFGQFVVCGLFSRTWIIG